jgi:hypothetical protein
MNSPARLFNFEISDIIIAKPAAQLKAWADNGNREIGHDPASPSASSKHPIVEQPKGSAGVRPSKYKPPRDQRVQMAKEAIIEEFPKGIWGVPFRTIYNKVCENHSTRGLLKPSEATVKRAKGRL